MRGPISDTGPGPVGVAYRTSGPVPALFHEDPLFLELCAAFDELLGPVVTALDCFPAYLDPWLAPDDFLDWLGTLVGAGTEDSWSKPRRRAHIAGAVRAYGVRGTVAGIRDAAAAAAGVPVDQVRVAECGAVVWASAPGATELPPFDQTVTVSVALPPAGDRDTAAVTAAVRDAVEPNLPISHRLRIKLVKER